MRKRFLSLLVAVAVLCSFLPQITLFAHAEPYSGQCGEHLTWHFDPDSGALTIEGYGEMDFDSAPWEAYCEAITSVSLPQTLTALDSYAFQYCRNLKELYIPDGIERIPDSLCYHCESLTQLRLPKELKEIGFAAFQRCAVKELIFPETLVSIDRYAFNGCGLQKAAFSGESLSIGNEAFIGCTNLTELAFSEKALEIGESAFYSCTGLTKLSFSTEQLRIADNAFCQSTGLREISFLGGEAELGLQAFQYCTGLKKVVFGSGNIIIGNGAFEYCYELKEVRFAPGEIVVEGFAFESCSALEEIAFPEGLRSIGSSAFDNCVALKRVTFPKGLRSIGNYAFQNCGKLTKAYLQDGLVSIEDSAFFGCSALNEVILPEGLEKIGDRAFYGCTALNSIVVPKSVTSIGYDALGIGLYGDTYSQNKDFVMYGYPYSASQYYAKENKFKFVPLDEKSGFCDVKPGEFYYDPMLWAVENGVTNGTSRVSFEPGASCTRAQVVTFLWRANGSPEPENATNRFVDVQNDYYYKAVLWAVEKGITNGTDDTHFSPEQSCTRAQVVTFLWRAKNSPAPKNTKSRFVDVQNDYYYKPVLWAVEKEITNGTDDTHFSPEQSCTRAQVVTFLYRAQGK